MPVKLKLDDEGHVVVQDGKPVYIMEDGKEVAYDANYSNTTITRLNNENRDLRKRAEDAETAAKAFEGIEDPAKAIEALQTVANLDQGQLVTAGKVKEIQDAAKAAADSQVKDAAKASEARIKLLEQERDGVRDELFSEKIGGAFNRSKFISDRCAIPSDLVQARFGPQFKYEDKRVVAYDQSGNKIYSRANPGELANFDEAIEMLIDSYPHKEQILKGANNSGGGAEHGSGGQPNRTPKGNMIGTKQERIDAIKSRFPDLESKT